MPWPLKVASIAGVIVAFGIFLEALEPGFLREVWRAIKDLHRD